MTLDWFRMFDKTPKKDGERVYQYYHRVAKETGYSVTQVQRNYGVYKKNGFSVGIERVKKEGFIGSKKSPCKILLFDIETSPIEAYVWSRWKQNVGDSQVISDWFMLIWSAKWLFEDKCISAIVTPKEAVEKDDKRIVTLLWEMFNEADILIGHNAMKFDVKKTNARFLIHSLTPPSPYRVIDTLLHSRNQFANSSNRLDELCRKLGLNRKMEHEGFDLWASCCRGDKAALKRMEAYNIQDVRALEDLYLTLRPWIQPHPNIGLHILDGIVRCPTCASDDIRWGNDYYTTVSVFKAFTCNNCGAHGRSRKTDIPVAKRAAIMSSLPKSR